MLLYLNYSNLPPLKFKESHSILTKESPIEASDLHIKENIDTKTNKQHHEASCTPKLSTDIAEFTLQITALPYIQDGVTNSKMVYNKCSLVLIET